MSANWARNEELMVDLSRKKILITGGTGSLGKTLLRRLLSGANGTPERIVVFSRDEAKQHDLRVEYLHRKAATHDTLYQKFNDLLDLRVGDVRDRESLRSAVRGMDIVFHAAALKQVPSCEYFPFQAVLTNVVGAQNLVEVVSSEAGRNVETVVGISTDKAVGPVNVMGMTKSLQERLMIQANLGRQGARFINVRYGNVLASRGSVIPLFHDQIRAGGPVTITDERMTRFLISLESAVDVILAAVADAQPGETYIPRIPAAKVTDIASALIGDRPIETRLTGVRPGEKLHESLVSDEEGFRTVERGRYYVIAPILPELRATESLGTTLNRAYTSADDLMSTEDVRQLLTKNRLLVEHAIDDREELLR